jgi:hypothetical protein
VRRELADALRAIADWLCSVDHHELVEITDEYGVCRARLALTTDDKHHIDSDYADLPRGWNFRTVEES